MRVARDLTAEDVHLIDESGLHRRSYAWWPMDRNILPLAERSGLEYFSALRDSTLPQQPITQTIGWKVTAVELGFLQLSIIPAEHLFHGGGLLHGGVIATLLDSAMSGAVMSTLVKRQACTTLQLNIHNVRSVRLEGLPLFAEGRIRHAGTKIATAEGSLCDASGKLYAHASTTCLIL